MYLHRYLFVNAVLYSTCLWVNNLFKYISRPEEYKKKVSEYVKKYASEEALRQTEGPSTVSSDSESSMSDFSEDEAQVSLHTVYLFFLVPKYLY